MFFLLQKGFSPLHIAAKYGNVDAAKTLMANGGDANCVGKNGLTPLHVATHYNQIEMVQLLLDKGSNPHAIAKVSIYMSFFIYAFFKIFFMYLFFMY